MIQMICVCMYIYIYIYIYIHNADYTCCNKSRVRRSKYAMTSESHAPSDALHNAVEWSMWSSPCRFKLPGGWARSLGNLRFDARLNQEVSHPCMADPRKCVLGINQHAQAPMRLTWAAQIRRANLNHLLFGGSPVMGWLNRDDIICQCMYVMQCNAMHCTALHCTALHCTALQCNAMQCNAM